MNVFRLYLNVSAFYLHSCNLARFLGQLKYPEVKRFSTVLKHTSKSDCVTPNVCIKKLISAQFKRDSSIKLRSPIAVTDCTKTHQPSFELKAMRQLCVLLFCYFSFSQRLNADASDIVAS